MQFFETTTDDLKPGFSTYLLNRQQDGVDFVAYTGSTATGATKEGIRENAMQRGYFLRKGFSDAIDIDPDVMTPVYMDNDGNEVHPKTKDEAISLIYSSRLNISGFKFNKDATEEQKEKAFVSLVNRFVNASKNLDFSSETNLFMIHANQRRVGYHNGGSQDIQIDGADVQEKLGMDTPAVRLKHLRRERMEILAGKAKGAEVSEKISEKEKNWPTREWYFGMKNFPKLALAPNCGKESFILDLNKPEYKKILENLKAGERLEIGRQPQSEKGITIPSECTYVSRRHCSIEKNDDGSFVLRDDSSSNGTGIVQKKIDEEHLPKLSLAPNTGASFTVDLSKPEYKKMLEGLKKGEGITIGRAPGSDIQTPESNNCVSRKHCSIKRMEDGSLALIDTSLNGTDLIPAQKTREHDGPDIPPYSSGQRVSGGSDGQPPKALINDGPNIPPSSFGQRVSGESGGQASEAKGSFFSRICTLDRMQKAAQEKMQKAALKHSSRVSAKSKAVEKKLSRSR